MAKRQEPKAKSQGPKAVILLSAHGRDNQVAVEPHLKLRIFVQPDIVSTEEQAGSRTKAGADGSANGCAFPSTQHSSTGSTHTGANGDVRDNTPLVRALSGKLTFIFGGSDGMIAGNACNRADQ